MIGKIFNAVFKNNCSINIENVNIELTGRYTSTEKRKKI